MMWRKTSYFIRLKKLRNIGRYAYCRFQKLQIFTCNHADTMQSYVHVSKETIIFLPKVWRWSHPFFQAFYTKIITVKNTLFSYFTKWCACLKVTFFRPQHWVEEAKIQYCKNKSKAATDRRWFLLKQIKNVKRLDYTFEYEVHKCNRYCCCFE